MIVAVSRLKKMVKPQVETGKLAKVEGFRQLIFTFANANLHRCDSPGRPCLALVKMPKLACYHPRFRLLLLGFLMKH